MDIGRVGCVGLLITGKVKCKDVVRTVSSNHSTGFQVSVGKRAVEICTDKVKSEGKYKKAESRRKTLPNLRREALSFISSLPAFFYTRQDRQSQYRKGAW